MAIVDYLSTTLSPVTDWLTDFVAAHPIVATLVTVGSIASSMWNNHKNRAATVFGHSMQAITHLDQRWESDDLKCHRSIAAFFLVDSVKNPETCAPQTALEQEAVNAVFNFLETVGCFVRTNAIAPRTAWQLFGSAAQLYVEAAAKQLAEYRNPHATVYSEMQYLYLASRVEEERRCWPLAWLWSRITATWLTIKAGSGDEETTLLRVVHLYHILYSVMFSRIHDSKQIPALFSRDDLIKYLSRESRLGGE